MSSLKKQICAKVKQVYRQDDDKVKVTKRIKIMLEVGKILTL